MYCTPYPYSVYVCIVRSTVNTYNRGIGSLSTLYTGHFYTIKGSTMELYGSTVLSNEVWIDLYGFCSKSAENSPNFSVNL